MSTGKEQTHEEEKEGAKTPALLKRVVMFSGGVGSWAAAKRVANQFGTEGMVLLFADTKMEDGDLYRFIEEAADNIGVPITRLCDGRTPWEVYESVRFIGNSRIDPCAKLLKRQLLNKWRDDNCDPANTIIYFGIDWTERHRMDRLQTYVAPWKCEAPLCEPPLLSKAEIFKQLERAGIETPRLYRLGFAHNNCGGFCCKAGKSHFALLLRQLPDRYAFHEAQEKRLRETCGINGTILTKTSGGVKRPITLQEFRESIEARGEQVDFYDDLAAGCGCSLPIENEEAA